MTRFSAANLDLSRMPAPDVIETVDFEAILAERLADLKRRLAAVGIPFDVDGLESDPAVKLEEADAYREALDLAKINDAARAVMVAFSWGGNLDHLGAFYGVRRRIVSAANPNASPPTGDVYENDAEFRARIQIAPEALPYAGLTGGGYRHRALQAAPAVKDVRVVKRRDARGHPVMDVVLLDRTGDGTASTATVDAVFRTFLDDDATQLTDVVTVRSARIVPYEIAYTLKVPRGPDAQVIRATSEAQVRAMAAELHRIGTVVPTDAIIAAARIRPTVKLELTSPAADVDPGVDGAAWCTSVVVTTEIVDV